MVITEAVHFSIPLYSVYIICGSIYPFFPSVLPSSRALQEQGFVLISVPGPNTWYLVNEVQTFNKIKCAQNIVAPHSLYD